MVFGGWFTLLLIDELFVTSSQRLATQTLLLHAHMYAPTLGYFLFLNVFAYEIWKSFLIALSSA
jgi:hypothetical protein